MAAAPEKLAALRHLLAERFPTAPRTTGRVLATGIPTLDEATGGLPLSAITEVVCEASSCGGHLLIGQLLAATRAARKRVALIDGTDSFDPQSFDKDLLAHLVWVRCPSIPIAFSAADLLARDANLGLVILDLRRAPESELWRIPGPQWYRLQRAVEPTELALVVETPRASVPSAQVRLKLSMSHLAGVPERDRSTLINELSPTLQRQRLQSNAAAG
jgi:hypothetical protein